MAYNKTNEVIRRLVRTFREAKKKVDVDTTLKEWLQSQGLNGKQVKYGMKYNEELDKK